MNPKGDRRTTDFLYASAQMAKFSELRPTTKAIADSVANANDGVEFRVTANVGERLRFIVYSSYNLPERAIVNQPTTLMFD